MERLKPASPFNIIKMKTISYIIILLMALAQSLLYSQDFTITWQNCYGGSEADYAMDIFETEEGYLLVGNTESWDGEISNKFGGQDIWLVQIDTTGMLIWEKCLGGSLGDGAHRIFLPG